MNGNHVPPCWQTERACQCQSAFTIAEGHKRYESLQIIYQLKHLDQSSRLSLLGPWGFFFSHSHFLNTHTHTHTHTDSPLGFLLLYTMDNCARVHHANMHVFPCPSQVMLSSSQGKLLRFQSITPWNHLSAALYPGCMIKSCVLIFKNVMMHPGWVLSWLERHPIHQNVVSLIPSQGAYGRQVIDVSLTHRCFSLSSSLLLAHSLSLPSSHSKINKHILGWGLKKKFWCPCTPHL